MLIKKFVFYSKGMVKILKQSKENCSSFPFCTICYLAVFIYSNCPLFKNNKSSCHCQLRLCCCTHSKPQWRELSKWKTFGVYWRQVLFRLKFKYFLTKCKRKLTICQIKKMYLFDITYVKKLNKLSLTFISHRCNLEVI